MAHQKLQGGRHQEGLGDTMLHDHVKRQIDIELALNMAGGAPVHRHHTPGGAADMAHGHGQHGHVVRPPRVPGQIGGGGGIQAGGKVTVRQHHTLRPAGGARGVELHSHIIGL